MYRDVNKWQALLTVNEFDRCNFLTHISAIPTYKTKDVNSSLHSLTKSSSQANNLLYYFHASPPTPQPKDIIYATVTNCSQTKQTTA